jgi:parallel beta-helix repeat protein
MNSRIKALAALLCSLHAWQGWTQTNVVSGTLMTNTVLSGTNLILGTVVVTNGVVLTIEPGTQVLMNTNATMVVYGQLLANGTTNEPINITRATTAARWSRFRFVRAQPSRFANCVIEWANCAGDHQSYYDNDCNTNTPPLARNYTEAIVALATRLEIEGCTFRNLVGGGTGTEGDAISIISDDIQFPGEASAHIRNCRFQSIGQAIHSRFSPTLIENNTFSDKRGDNDDVDLYGESTPVPVIRHNTFLAGHEDKINPTRCSAIIYGNIVMGSDDHGIVLRDRGRPIVFNNLVINCSQGGISVQNQCDALIANNTIVNCGRGIRLFDHFDRAGPPYCLFRGSGRATVINNIIWDSSINSLALTDSTNGHSWVWAAYNNIEGGQTSTSVSANSTLIWGPGNINADPLFAGAAANNYRLRTNSPSIDAGTNVLAYATNFTFAVTNDFDGIPRPLDGNGDGALQFDIGAHEFLLATADSNGDGIPDGWTWQHRLNPTAPDVAASNPDDDTHTTGQEWVADTNPVDPQSLFGIASVTRAQQVGISFLSSSNRVYTLQGATNLAAEAASWLPIAGQTNVRGTGGTLTLNDATNSAQKFYRIEVRVP